MTNTNIWAAVRLDGELDVIVFRTGSEAAQFEEQHPEYHIIETGIYSLKEALEIFE